MSDRGNVCTHLPYHEPHYNERTRATLAVDADGHVNRLGLPRDALDDAQGVVHVLDDGVQVPAAVYLANAIDHSLERAVLHGRVLEEAEIRVLRPAIRSGTLRINKITVLDGRHESTTNLTSSL